jgi:elongation factor 1-gamma
MNNAPTLFFKENCYKAKIIFTLNEFLHVKLATKTVQSLSPEDNEKLIKRSPTGSFPLLQIGDNFLSGTRAILRYLISLSNESIIDFLHPSNKLESAHIEMWIDYAVSHIWTIRESLLIQDDDKLTVTTNEDIKKEALNDLRYVLERVNEDLIYKTFLVTNNLTLADLILACSLKEIYEYLIDSDTILKFNNLTRWFKLVSNLKQYKTIYGEVKLQI